MRYLLTALMVLLLAGNAFTQRIEKVALHVNVSTTQTVTAKSDVLNGYLEQVYVDVSTNTDIDVDIFATNDFTGLKRTLFSADDVTIDTNVYPRIKADGTDGAAITHYIRFPLNKEKIILQGSDCSVTNGRIKAFIIYESETQ